MTLTLLRPIWLLLLIPLLAGLWWLPMPMRLLQMLRSTTLGLILTGMVGLAILLPVQSGTVVVVVDRSLSMPPSSDSQAKEVLDHLARAMGPRDRMGVVSFGETASIEQAPEHGGFSDFVQQVGPDGSRLGDGIDKALSLIPRDSPGSIIVLSDGNWTGPDPIAMAAKAADRGIRIDYRSIQRPPGSDLAIARFEAPGSLNAGESFTLAGFVHSPVAQDVSIELKRNGQRIAGGTQHVLPGITRVVFRDTAGDPGTIQYLLSVHSPLPDPVPENNEARALVGVEGARPILLIADSKDSDLARLLKAGRLNVKVATADEVSWSLESLSSYAAVLIENVPAESIGTGGMETLAAWVESGGGGLGLTGGRRSFGPGGYFRSPLDPIMPVSMELRREHRKLSMAIAVVMDRSGSMAMPVANGRSKMDLADLGAAQVLDLMAASDELGVIAVDTDAHSVVDLRPVGDGKTAARSRILSVASEGGGIYIDVAMHAALDWTAKATPETRHIILFADASDSEQGGDYRDTVDKCARLGITVSVIGMGTPADHDVELLKDIAARGKGQFYITNNVEELPRLFAQDTFIVARSTFIDEPSKFEFTGGMSTMSSSSFANPPALGGYNLCYLRPGADLGAVTRDEYKAPIVATWQAGLGRVAAFTGEASGKYTGPLARWPQVGELHASLARWIGGGQGNLPDHMMVTQEVRSGVCVVRLHLDPERNTQTLHELPMVTTLRGRIGEKPEVQKAAMRWSSPDMLELAIPLRGEQTSLSTVTIPGAGTGKAAQVSLSPVCLPYSPEFEPTGGRRMTTLSELARATSGDELVDSGSIWQKLPRTPRYVDLSALAMIGAVFVLLIEVLERRTGMVSAGLPMAWISQVAGRVRGLGGRREAAKTTTGEVERTPPWERGNLTPRPGARSPSSAPGVAPTPDKPGSSPAAGGVVDSLREARNKSRNRTGDLNKDA